MKILRQLAVILGCATLLTQAFSQLPPGGGGGSGGGPGGGSNWQVLSVVRTGSNTYYNWIYDQYGNAQAYNFSMPWGGPEIANAYNGTHYNLTARMESAGTVKVRIQWVGSAPTPSYVWMKISASASYGLMMASADDPPPSASGDANDGIGDPKVLVPGGGQSSGYEYFKVPVGSNGIAEKTITLSATGYYTAPYASVGASCGASWASPDVLVFDGDLMTFDNVLQSIINQNSSFASTSGSAYPVNGWQKVNGIASAYPVLMKKGTNINVSLHYKADVDWAEPSPAVQYDLSASHSSYQTFINWPIQTGTASDSWQNKSFISNQTLQNKIYVLQYDLVWNLAPEQPFNIANLGTGVESMYVTWDTPLGETVTRKRIHWAVTTASGSTTEEQAADKIALDLGARTNKSTSAVLNPGLEWSLLDGTVNGDCDDWARMMKRAMNLLGIAASTLEVHASTNSNVRDLQNEYIDPETGQNCYLIMDFSMRTTVGAPNSGYGWNAYEGACETANRVYTLFPYLKGISDRDIFNQLGFTQFWVLTNGTPGVGYNWYVTKVVAYEPKPVLTP